MQSFARYVLFLLMAVVVTAAAALAQDSDQGRDRDKERKERRTVMIERLEQGDCPRVLTRGQNGRLLRLGSFGYLGVSTTALTSELRTHFGAPEDVGVMIGSVEEDSSAVAAGLQVGDIITRLDDDDVTSGGSLSRLVRRHEEGDEVTIEYWRGGKVATTTVALGEHQRCGFDISSAIDLERIPQLDHLKNLKLDQMPRLEGLLELYEFDGEALEEVRNRLHEALEGQDWQYHLERIRGVDLNKIEERLQEAMERLHKLEDHIDTEKKRIQEDEDKDENLD